MDRTVMLFNNCFANSKSQSTALNGLMAGIWQPIKTVENIGESGLRVAEAGIDNLNKTVHQTDVNVHVTMLALYSDRGAAGRPGNLFSALH